MDHQLLLQAKRQCMCSPVAALYAIASTSTARAMPMRDPVDAIMGGLWGAFCCWVARQGYQLC